MSKLQKFKNSSRPKPLLRDISGYFTVVHFLNLLFNQNNSLQHQDYRYVVLINYLLLLRLVIVITNLLFSAINYYVMSSQEQHEKDSMQVDATEKKGSKRRKCFQCGHSHRISNMCNDPFDKQL